MNDDQNHSGFWGFGLGMFTMVIVMINVIICMPDTSQDVRTPKPPSATICNEVDGISFVMPSIDAPGMCVNREIVLTISRDHRSWNWTCGGYGGINQPITTDAIGIIPSRKAAQKVYFMPSQ